MDDSSGALCTETTVFTEAFREYKVFLHGNGGATGTARITIRSETTPSPTVSPTMRPTTAFPTPASTSWFLGDGAESCDDVCTRNGLSGTCNVERLNAVNSEEKVAFVAFVLGVNCNGTYRVENVAADPSFENNVCWAQGDGSSTCSAAGQSSTGEPGRFCCCSANTADCPVFTTR